MRNSLCAALLWLAAVCACLTHAERTCSAHEACIELTQCPELAKLLPRPGGNRKPSASDQERLRAAHCGFQGSKAKVCCVLLPTYKECGPTTIPDKIINGNQTQVMEFPWAARLGYRSPYGGTVYQCGGALISSRYVITAAHCTEKSSPPVTVRLGEHDARSDVDCSIIGNTSVCAPPAVDVRVEEVISHPEYVKSVRRRDGLWNDIALLRLARPVAFTRGVAPVCLPNDMPRGQAEKDQLMREQKGFTFTVVGWGRIGKDEDADVSDVLLKLNLQTMKHADCAAKYSRFPNKLNEELQMCGIAKNGQDVCSGDSGGPLTSVMSLSNRKVRSVLRGIVSFGPTVCASEGVPAIFTRVTHYLPWIMSTLRP